MPNLAQLYYKVHNPHFTVFISILDLHSTIGHIEN